MAVEWKQKCKDCGKLFGYSDISLQKDLRKGLSRAERCDDCRKQHAYEIKSIASSHFALKPRKSKSSILGYPFLGQIDHGERILKEVHKEADNSGMDVGLKDHHIKQVYEALEQNQVLVIVAPTGTGKSTFLPSRFINPLDGYPTDYFTKRGPIIVTQPRIPAARDIPKTIGNKLVGSSTGHGFDIGYRHGDRNKNRKKLFKITDDVLKELKNNLSYKSFKELLKFRDRVFDEEKLETIFNKVSFTNDEINEIKYYAELKGGENYDRKRNRLIFVTDGSLINWIEEGQIADFSMIILDEAHERSCNIDLILGLAKKELLKYPYLKFIIASATIDAESFVNYFSSSTTVIKLDFSECQKIFDYKEFPFGKQDLKKEDFDDSIVEKNKEAAKSELKKYEKNIAPFLANKIVELINTTSEGGILGFLHGEEHITRAVKLINDKIKGRKDIKVFPLYTGVGTENIEAALADIKERRIVIATNIAETSLTIRDIVYVVDSGLIKQSDWNPVTCRQELNTKFHSKDGCKQRWGRAGRVKAGFVYKLYTKEQFIKYFPNHTSPEIKRANAEIMILGAMASGVNDIENFSMLEKPDKVELDRALNVVKKRGIVDKDFDFTEAGREVYNLSKALRSVLDKVEYNSTQRALDVASFLILADKYTCLIEAVTAICMMPRMGNALYWGGDGLLQWDKNLNLVSKDYRIRLIDSFKAGCVDDLDFACKLYSLFEGCFFDHKYSGKYASYLAKEYSLNLENFQLLKDIRDNLIDVFSQGKKNSNIRQLDLSLVSRVRILASLSWNDRIVSIKKGDTLLFESKEYGYQGTISDNCAGDWSKEKKAIIGILDQNENDIFIDGKRTKAPVANFLIKHIESPASKNVIDIISAFRKYQTDEEVINAFSNCVSDLNIPINMKVVVDETKKPVTISKYFSVSRQFANSTNADDLFIRIEHSSTENEDKSLYEIEIPKGVKATDNLILEQWIRKSKKVVAVLDSFSSYDETIFSNLKVKKIAAYVKRPVFDIKGKTGAREIIGFIISIGDFHYTIPIENISIELQNDSLKELVGQTLTLNKTRVTATSNQPIFSIVPLIENEREELVKDDEVKGVVSRITGTKVFFNVKRDKGEFTHLVSIPTSYIKDSMKFIELDGEVTLDVKLRQEDKEKLTIDCLDDDDLTFDETDAIKDLLNAVKKNSTEYINFTKRNIQINETEISTDRTISFEHFNELSHLYPILHFALRTLYAESWELKVKDFSLGIKKAFDEAYKEVTKLKTKALTTEPKAMQKILKEFKWHTYKMSALHQQIIKTEIDKVWELTRTKEREERNREYQRTKLYRRLQNQKDFLAKLQMELKEIPPYKTNWITTKNQKINEISAEIKMLEAQIQML